ncbi:MAG: hypothetical protein RSE41_10180, partial [Clostridia bacterium]
WEEFKNENISVHCKTEKEAKDFIKCAYEHGISWKHDKKDCINWIWYKNKTCYDSKNLYSEEMILHYSPISYYKEKSYKILEWSDYMKKEKEFTIEDLRSDYMVELADESRCMVVTDHCGLSLYDTKTLDRCMTREYTKFKNESQSNAFYDIVKVYGYKKDALNQNTIDDRELLWEYEEPKQITLKCDTENYSITKNAENTIIENKNNKIAVQISNDDMKELLPMIQELFKKHKTVNKFEKDDIVMIDSRCSYRGERGIVLDCFNGYVWVNLCTSNKIIKFNPDFLIKV